MIKNRTIILTIGFCLASGMSGKLSAQDSEIQNVIKTNIFGYFVGQYQFAYERTLNEKVSVQLNAGYIYTNSVSSNAIYGSSYKLNYYGFIIIPEVRYYLRPVRDAIPIGFYTGTFVRLKFITENLTDTSNPLGTDVSRTEKASVIGGGFVAGYQKLLMNDAFSFDVAIGPQITSRSSSITYKNGALNASNPPPSYNTVGEEAFSSKFIGYKAKFAWL